MDSHFAKDFGKKLAGKHVGGWVIGDLINHGKSAVVLHAKKGLQQAALKVFDPELIARYGKEIQLKRIERERSLAGKIHPNLVEIFDGGEDDGLLYIAMEFFPGKNLATVLKEIPAERVRKLLSQIASAARFLEDQSFAHRDIKPENIGISEDLTHAKLLDLGVVRPLDLSNLTDEGEQKLFIGTLQYSPPELLFREEDQSMEAWRAISFYQLGGVLHDLLMRKPLFADHQNPYGRLVRAVEREIPRIDASDADADLRLLAQNCLSKSPTHRLNTVTWEDFNRPKVQDPLEAARRRISQHRVAAGEAAAQKESKDDLLKIQEFALKTSIESTIVSTIKAESLPRYSTQRMREPNPFLLRVMFEPSAAAGLRNWFSIFCHGEVLDPETSLQELKIWAAVSRSREEVPAEPDPKASSSLTRGALIDQDVRGHIAQCLILLYARALDLPLVGGEATVWLDPGEQQ